MQKQHYYLVSAKLIFVDPAQQEIAHTHDMNTVIRTDNNRVTTKDIGRTQQTLQMLLIEQLANPSLVITNVHINTVSYLGHMTEEEFHPTPLAA